MQCAYCNRQATLKIPSVPEEVCQAHAIEFWTGLLAFARDHAEPCEREEAPCLCWTCNQLSASKGADDRRRVPLAS